MKHSDKYRNWFDREQLVSDLMDQAADDIDERDAEIERLREALRAINRKNDNPAWFNPEIHEIVETALKQKESE